MFICVLYVHYGEPCGSTSSFGFVDAHWGYSDSFGFDGSFLRVLDMVVFIGVRWVHLGAPLWSSGSLMLVGFIRALPWGCRLKWVRRVQSGVL